MKHYVSMNDHDFEKQNLVTQKGGYDVYKCTSCGLLGKRTSIDDTIVCRSNKKCNRPAPATPKKVVITDNYVIRNFGFEAGVEYETTNCPDEYKGKYDNDVWVYSERRKEPIRLISHEYQQIA